jgi:hypothetical protein
MIRRERHTPAVVTAAVRPEAAAAPRLRGAWLVAARGVWLGMAGLALGLFVASLFPYYDQLLTLTTRDVDDPVAFRTGLGQLGLAVAAYSVYRIALIVAFAVVFAAVAALIFWRKSDEWLGLFVSLTLVLFGANFPNTLDALAAVYPAWDGLVQLVGFLGFVPFFILPYIFPDGRFVPHWTRWLALLLVIVGASDTFVPAVDFDLDAFPVPDMLLFAGLLGSILFAQTYRYVRVSDATQRQQTKWVMFGFTVALVGFIAPDVVREIAPSLAEPGLPAVVYDIVSGHVYIISFLLVPLSIGISILRYRLWDIDLLINRALVYGTLTGVLALVYVASVVLLQQGFRALTGQESELAIIASTLAIAGLFQPLRRRLQGFIDRRFYRRKYDAARTLAVFSARLRDEVDLTTLTDDLVAVVEETMQPAQVSLWLPPSSHNRSGNPT